MGSERTKDGSPRGIAIIVPARNATATLGRCLASLARQRRIGDSLTVVDDASTDDTATVARAQGAQVLTLEQRGGPARARNAAAAAAAGDVLFFVDADVEIAPDAVERVRETFLADPSLAAVFGSYDDEPADASWVARYKNLAHHLVHQRARAEAQTFFAACGAIRRSVFLASGGFDGERYPRPAIEDVELGLRLVAAGHRIRLDHRLQGKHLKPWRLGSWLRSDLFDRAVPWTRLALERGGFGDDLNLGWRDRAAAMTAVAIAGSLPLALVSPLFLLASGALVLLALALNHDLYGLLRRKGGVPFAAAGFLFHQIHYATALLGLAIGAVQHARAARSPAPFVADGSSRVPSASALRGLRIRR